MRIADLTEAYVPKIASPRDEARRFGTTLAHLFWHHHPDADDDVNNYDYLDDETGKALRYRYIVGPNYLAFLHEMMPQINKAGWHLTLETKLGRKNLWQLVFEPIKTAALNGVGVFWHLSPVQNVAAIEQQGLLPKPSRHGINYPQDRIYLLRREEDAEQMAQVFGQRDKRKIDYAVFKVDLRQSKGIKLHTDPEIAKVAVYTTQPIPPQFVSLAAR